MANKEIDYSKLQSAHIAYLKALDNHYIAFSFEMLPFHQICNTSMCPLYFQSITLLGKEQFHIQ